MDRRTLSKFIIVLTVGLLVIAVSLYSFLSPDELDEVDNIENMFKTENEILTDENATHELHEPIDELGEVDNEIADSYDETMSNGHNFEKEAIDQYGKDVLDHAKNVTEQGVTLWITDEKDFSQWEGISTIAFLNYIDNEHVYDPESIMKELDLIKLTTVQSPVENEIVFEVEASWFYRTEGHLTDKQSKLFYVTVKLENKTVLIDKIIEL